jgi:hypothetical protein
MKKARALCLMAALAVVLAVPGASFAWTVKHVTANLSCVGRRGPAVWGRANSFTGSVHLNPQQTVLSITGFLLNACPGGRASVWLSWYEGTPALCLVWGYGCYNSYEKPTAGFPNRIVRIVARHSIPLVNPSGIAVTVCSTYRGWHCGRSSPL